jgi:AraC-like DNA-binding protein/quercetin dioxygenase-like cupin family protein
MNVHQDGLTLDKGFPFQINEVTLVAGDNADEAFHWHSFLEITCILEGRGCYYVSDRAYEVSPGDIVIFNSAELHGWQVFQSEMRVLAMVFSDSLVAGYGDLMDMEYLRPFVGRGSNFRNRIGRDQPCAAQIAGIMQEILGEWRLRSDGYPLMIKADVLRVLTMLVRHYNDNDRTFSQTDPGKALRRLQPALEYIDANYSGRITLKQAAEQVYMSPNYFSHYFHAATHISFSDYVTLRRIRKARELMETSGKSIYEIAMECGFPNSSNFYRLYKKHTGESPRQGR